MIQMNDFYIVPCKLFDQSVQRPLVKANASNESQDGDRKKAEEQQPQKETS
jgi:hypothetical protein